MFLKSQDDTKQAWVKPVEPIVKGVWSYAVVYLNGVENGASSVVN